MEISFTNCEKSLSQKDIKLIQQDLNISLPESFISHYLKFNGGTPSKSIWIDKSGKFDENEIRDFLPILYFQEKGDDPDFTLNGIAKEQWALEILPKNLLPFAIDWGGNYFCLDHRSGEIKYFIRDVWSEKISKEKNFEVNSRFMSPSFGDFLHDLIAIDND